MGLYTHLVNDHENGVEYEKQALPNTNHETFAVPLSVYIAAGSTFNFSVVKENFPVNLIIYIEDRLHGSIHNITSNNYQTSTVEALTGKAERFYLFVSANPVWLGTTNTDWQTATNWSTNTVPTTTDTVLITNATNQPLVTGNLTIENMSITSGATLTVNGDLTIGNLLTINSDKRLSGSLIVSGNSTGQITYNRHQSYNSNTNLGWHLIGAPVAGETLEDVISHKHTNLADGSASKKGIASYNNNLSTNRWEYQTSTSTGSIISGKGYSVKRKAIGIVPFTGTLVTNNITYPIAQGSGTIWNLIANPFSSFIKVKGDATSFYEVNQHQFESNAMALYVWNSKKNNGNGGYDIINNSSSTTYIAPGQAFFVSSKSGAGLTVSFNKNMQTHTSGGVFYKGHKPTSQIELEASINDFTKSTTIKLLNSTEVSTKLDPGFDSEVFENSTKELSLFSRTADLSSSINLGLQVVPFSKSENLIIPIGLHSDSEATVTFNGTLQNIPNKLNVFLEDRKANKVLRLNVPNFSYTTQIKQHEKSTGRFFIHTSNQENIDQPKIFNNVLVYSSAKNNLRVVGLPKGAVIIEVFSVLGKKLFQTSFNSDTSVKNITLKNSDLKLFLVNIKTVKGTLTKKIVNKPY